MTRARLAEIPKQPWAEWLRFIAALVVIPLLVWGIRMEIRLAEIEGNRFTSKDATSLMAILNTKVDKQGVPPPEVRQMLERLELHQKEMSEMLSDIRERLARLEAR